MFNEEQKQAIAHGTGAAMILAGPGTGKTTVLTERIKTLIESGVAKEEELLVVTFTKAAALEMQMRYERKVSSSSCRITFGTFHSIFLKIIRESNPGFRGVAILSEEDKNRILKEIVMRLGVDCGDMYEFIRNISSDISKVKGNGEDVKKFVSGVCERDIFVTIYEEYDRALKVERKIDFDDMIIMCHDLLMNDKAIRKYWQSKFRFVMIDEFQDINRIQYDTVSCIVGEEENIFIVGDDDQSIYGFRGSDNQIMFDFKKDYHKVKVINLNTNYRSSKEIIDVAFRLIENNEKRFRKNIISFKGKGSPVEIVEFENNILQYKYMAKKVAEYIDQGTKPEDIAILVRNNGSMPVIKNFLGENNVKVSVRMKSNIYKTPMAMDLLSYVKCATMSLEDSLACNIDFNSIINKPYRLIGRQIVASNTGGIQELLDAYENSREITQNIKDFLFQMKMISKLDPYSAINYIRYGVGYEEYLKKYAVAKNIRPDQLLKSFDRIWHDAKQFKSLAQWIKYVETQAELGTKLEMESGNVNIMTMHASKGLEFKIVFLPDVNQGVIPEARAIREYDVEEERRVFFVAITRASEHLHVMYNDNVMGRKCQKSQFIQEMSWHS